MRIEKLVANLLVTVFLLVGIGLLGHGVSSLLEEKEITKNYREVEGYFVDYEVYNTSKDDNGRTQTTYALTYEYVVGDAAYRVTTDYGTGNVPEIGSNRTIQYDPFAPEKAVITGVSGNTVTIFVGGIFVLVPICIIVIYLAIKGRLGKLSWNVVDLVIGLVFLIVGLGVLYMLSGSLSMLAAFRVAGPFAVVPVLFLIVGAFEVSKSLTLRD